MEPLGRQIARLRVEVGWTQPDLAKRAGISRPTVTQIEGGHRQPTFDTIQALQRAFARVGRTLVLSEAPVAGRLAPSVDRREFLRTSAAAAVPALFASNAGTESPRGLSDALVTTYELQLEAAALARPIQPPRELLPELELRLHTLTARIDERDGSDSLRRRLLSVAAGTHALAGWVRLMLEHRNEARYYLKEGERLAISAEDSETRSLILMLRADLVSPVQTGGLQGSTRAARRYLEQAMSVVPAEAPITLRAPLYLRAAEEAAMAGTAAESDRLLEQGAEIAATGRVVTHPLRPYWTDWALQSWRGSCASILGRPEAIELLSRFKSEFPAHRPLARADLGAAYARAGEVDAAARTLSEAVALAMEHGHAGAIQRVNGTVHRHLARWADEPAVRDLTERLSEGM